MGVPTSPQGSDSRQRKERLGQGVEGPCLLGESPGSVGRTELRGASSAQLSPGSPSALYALQAFASLNSSLPSALKRLWQRRSTLPGPRLVARTQRKAALEEAACQLERFRVRTEDAP